MDIKIKDFKMHVRFELDVKTNYDRINDVMSEIFETISDKLKAHVDSGEVTVTPTIVDVRREDLDKAKQVSFVWSVDDVIGVRPKLTEEQALSVLLRARERHDCNVGVNWQVLKDIADIMYPESEVLE